MIRPAIFTIVAKNYIGLAKVLENSIKQHNQEVDFYIYVADEFDPHTELDSNVLVAKHTLLLSEDNWVNMTFKYDLTEFCTSIKPLCFLDLFSKGYDKVMYFDPDIYVFNSLSEIISRLDNHSVLLTPHINNIHLDKRHDHKETVVLYQGIYNLGFCGIAANETTIKMLNWWARNLKDYCFSDKASGTFTDQKWMDFIPGFNIKPSVLVLDSLGTNMAPWNFFEREIVNVNGVFYVKNRNEQTDQKDKLIFIHFAGYDYKQFVNGIIKRKRITNLRTYEDLNEVLEIYREAFVNNIAVFNSYIDLSYSYNTYDNGENIDKFHRRLYNGLIAEGNNISNPFKTANESYYKVLKKSNLVSHNNKTEKLDNTNVNYIKNKKKKLSIFFKIMFYILGYERFALFLRSLIIYTMPEEHTYLVNKHIKNKE